MLKDKFKSFGAYAGVLTIGGIGGMLYMLERDGDSYALDLSRLKAAAYSDLKKEVIEIRRMAQAAEIACAVATSNVEKVDQNYRNLKEYEVRNANSH